MAAGLTGGLDHGDCLIVARRSTKDGQEIFEAVAFWQWAYHIKVQACKSSVRQREFTQWGSDVVWLDRLAGVAASNELFHILLQTGPVVELADPSAGLLVIGVTKGVEGLDDDWS